MLPYYMVESVHNERVSRRKVYEVQFQRSQDLYASRKNRGFVGRMASVLHRNRLQDLDARLAGRDVVARYSAGKQVVRLDHITGTQGRAADFDRNFNPLNSRSRQRWTSIAIAHLAGDTLPPVELLKVGNEYFVSDGHHRVSVARALGATYIDANVVELVLQPANVPDVSLSSQPMKEALPC